MADFQPNILQWDEVVNLCVTDAGILCTNKHTDICEAIATSDCPLVAQKYIGGF